MSTLTHAHNQTGTPRNAELVAAAQATKAATDTRHDIIAALRADAVRAERFAMQMRAAEFYGTANAMADMASRLRANADRLEGTR